MYCGIDISTRTGLVVLNEHGEVLHEAEHKLEDQTPLAMRLFIDEIVGDIPEGAVVALEGFGYASRSGFLLGGIGWGVRMALDQKDNLFFIASPSQVKKFATGKGNADKRLLAVHVHKRWSYMSESDNITDAYVLAQMARAMKQGAETKGQQEVIRRITG